MKKLTIFALSLASVNAMAWEVNVKTGYEPARFQNFYGKDNKTGKLDISDGFVVGAEVIPFNKGVLELGLGVEAKLGTPFTDNKGLGSKYTKYSVDKQNLYTFPVYALGKLNVFRSEDNNYSQYVLGRFGYAPSFVKYDKGGEKTLNTSGLYYGTGLGVDLGPVTIEAIYDGIYRNINAKGEKVDEILGNGGVPGVGAPAAVANQESKGKSFRHSFGLRFGVKFGDYRTPKMVEEAPVVVEEEVVAPVVVEEPVILPTPTPAPKRQLIHASCADGKCIIHGFEIDGRVPSKEEQRNIQEIVQQVNDFALSGQVAVVGHTDATGSEAYNQKLSEKRASNVVKLLQEAGLKPEIQVMSITGKGELAPMDTNKTKAGRYNNRRVEIIFEQIEQ